MHTPAFLPTAPLPVRRLRPPRPAAISATASSSQPRRLRRLASAALLSLALSTTPASVHARQRKPSLTMTDQVPNFTLPSQAAPSSSSAPALLVKTFNVAKTVAPPVAAIAVAVWAISRLLRRAQQRQLRDFQTQLQSLSSMLDLDSPATNPNPTVADPARSARDIMDSSRRYRFRTDPNQVQDRSEDIQSKVQLDLFASPSTSAQSSPRTANTPPPSVEPATDFERAVADAIRKAVAAPEAISDATSDLVTAHKAAGLNDAEVKPAFERYVSRLASAYVDRAVQNVDTNDQECLRSLNELADVTSAASGLQPDARLVYVGELASEEKTREELYRRFALYCLSSEERVKSDLQALVDMQSLLQLGEKRAEQINAELAKGMFQVAVSAAMADGSLDKESRDALDTLKDSFGQFLDGGSADSIMSEVAVMRAMYSLQQLLQEQGVSEDDVRELRKMCAELGVDIDEMLRNADALGDALGPEAKEFVESLRGLLENTGSGDTGVVTTVAKPVNQGKDGSEGL